MARRDITGAVDFAYLETYAAGDQQVVEEVLAMFREQSSLWLRLLDPHGDPASWRDGAHTLKGASMGVGAFQLGQACEAAEAGSQNDGATRAALLDRVRDRLNAALMRHLGLRARAGAALAEDTAAVSGSGP